MNEIGMGVLFVLCFLTSAVCAWLLARAWSRSRVRLLLWSAVAFGFLAVNNALLVVDVMIAPDVSLLWARQGSALVAVAVLLYGFIREVDA